MTAPATFLNPKRIPVKGRDGDEREYYLSHFPAVAGREIVTQYPVTAMPKIGEYKTNEALMLRVLSFVAAIVPDGEGGERVVQLTTRELVDNHAGDYERLLRIEWAMMEYNTSFFGQGKGSTFFAGIEAKAKALISQTLTDFFAPIIAEKLASLHELRTVYTFEDAFNMLEIIAVNRFNEWAAMEAAKRR